MASRHSRFARSGAFNFPDISFGTAAYFTQSSNVCVEQAILVGIDNAAAQRERCFSSCSSTINTALARNSGENLFVILLMTAPLHLGDGANGLSGVVQHGPKHADFALKRRRARR